jgi:hypothetical protein
MIVQYFVERIYVLFIKIHEIILVNKLYSLCRNLSPSSLFGAVLFTHHTLPSSKPQGFCTCIIKLLSLLTRGCQPSVYLRPSCTSTSKNLNKNPRDFALVSLNY